MIDDLRSSFWHAAVSAAALLFLSAAHAAETDFGVRWRADSAATNTAYVEVTGIPAKDLERLRSRALNPAEWNRVLAVFVHGESTAFDPFMQAMTGQHAIVGEVLQFRPRFPLTPGVEYRAEFRPAALPAGKSKLPPLTAAFRIPKPPVVAKTTVTTIYPTADVLPENVLKFYVYFSAPMSRGDIYDHIKLRHESGREVDLPFLQIDEELWDSEMKRLTLFIDPGRIKRGVLPLEEVGPALEAGKNYELTIHGTWTDSSGSPLKQSFSKRFAVGQPDRAAIDPKSWKVLPPKASTMEPLRVDFGESLDHALALRLIDAFGEGERVIAGEKRLQENERVWQLKPRAAWKPGRYRLAVQKTIEDLAGNNIDKPFEVDLFNGVQRRLTNSVVKIPFEIR